MVSCKTPSMSDLLMDLKVCSRVYLSPFWLATLYKITSFDLHYDDILLVLINDLIPPHKGKN